MSQLKNPLKLGNYKVKSGNGPDINNLKNPIAGMTSKLRKK